MLSSQRILILVDLALPQGYVGSERLPKTLRVLKNSFNTGEYVLPRPGITSLATKTGLARGAFTYDDSLYCVYGTSLLKIDTDGNTVVTVGIVEGTANIDFAIGFNEAAIVVRETGGKGYTLASDVLTEITDPDFVASNSVTHINGRFVYIPFNGDPAFFSDVGAAATIDALSFFDAEELPDKNKGAANYKNILLIGGTDSFELFRDVGDTPVPYRRLNARIDFGYIGGLTEYSDTFAFIGREKDQDVGIYVIGPGTAPKISNEAIDTILTTYTETELSVAVPQRFKWRGYDLLCFTLARHSFGFLNGNWFLIDTMIDDERFPWRAGFVTHYQQKYYTFFANEIGRLDKINTDYGNDFERSIQFGVYQDGNEDFTAQSIELGVSQGYTATGSVGLHLSRDNVLFSDPYFRNVGNRGEYDKKLVWNYPGGLGYYEGFMGVKITTTSDIEFAADKLSIGTR